MGELDGDGRFEGCGVCAVRSPEGLDVEVLTRPCRVWSTVTVRRGPTVLAADVEVESGQLELSSGQQTQERLSFTLSPDWAPVNEWSPFAPYGQVARLLVHVEPDGGEAFTVDRGAFLLHEVTWDAGEETAVKVTAYSLLQRLVDDDFPFPTSPDGSSLRREVERLCYPHLVPSLDCGERTLPGGLSWGNRRVEALGKLADLFDLRFYVGADDVLHVVDAHNARVVASYSGEDLLLSEARKASHAVPNRWTAVADKTGGGKSHGGERYSHTVEVNAGPRTVSLYGVVHKVLQVQDGSQDAVVAAADRAMREATSGADQHSFKIVPDYRLDLGDVVTVTPVEGEAVTGPVTGLVMSLVSDAAAMRVDVKNRVVL